jgi:hypothetical protein
MDDPVQGFWRGLTGTYRYPTLGYQMFKKAQEPGFQPEDIGAFAVDVLVDPINYIGPGLAKVAGKAGAKAAFGLAARATKRSRILDMVVPENELALGVVDKIKKLRSDKEAIAAAFGGKDKFTWTDLIKRFEVQMPTPVHKALWESAKRGKKVHTTDLYKMLKENEWLVDAMRADLRLMDINWRPLARTGIQALSHEAGKKLLPVAAVLRNFGTGAGKKWAAGYRKALDTTRLEEVQLNEVVKEVFKGLSKRERVQAVMARENIELMGTISPKAREAAQRMGALIDEFGQDVAKWRDPLGNPLLVRGADGKFTPFEKNLIFGYYPHLFPASMFTRKGRRSMIEKLMGQGMDKKKAESIINNISVTNPKKVGQIEYARLKNQLGYEMDPVLALPKYFHDTLWRKNLANEFGVNNEILDRMFSDLLKQGWDQRWLRRVADATIGRNIHDRFWEGMAGHLTGFQALSKLGYATTVANSFQAPINQTIMHGFWNEAKALAGLARNTERSLGLAAFNRTLREDLLMMGAGKGGWYDKYMKLIGFNMSERKGRHLGAIAGLIDVDDMGRRWASAVGRKKERLASELMRKFDIPVSRLGPGGTVPQALREMAALRAADTTMHAFNFMELPLAWRDPFWRILMQFKSFIYKQSDFLGNQMLVPAMRYLATDGKAGDLMPLLRAAIVLPIGAELVAHFRDVAKAGPAYLYSGLAGYAKSGEWEPADWNWKKPFWEDPDPGMRIFSDLTYIGTLGIFGDAIDSAAEGRLWKWGLGPTGADIIEGLEAPFRGRLGAFATKEIPGAFGIPYGEDVFEMLRKEYREIAR